jgi:hypothetical protein
VAAPTKEWACCRSLAGIAGSNSSGDVLLSVVSVVCCEVNVPATASSLLQGSPTECGVSDCDLETSIMRKVRPTRAVDP